MQEIDTAVVFAKNCDDWRREYMTLALEIEREKKAAMAEGMARGMVNAIKNLMKNANITSERAMTMLGIPPADFGKYSALL